MPTAKLNSFMQDFMRRWPPPWKDGQKCYPKYITQLKVCPRYAAFLPVKDMICSHFAVKTRTRFEAKYSLEITLSVWKVMLAKRKEM